MSRKGYTTRRVKDRRNCTEHDIIQLHLGEFDPEDSPGLQLALEFLGDCPCASQSLSIVAHLLGEIIQKPVPRDYTRKKALLIKWFDENHDDIALMLGKIRGIGAPAESDTSDTDDTN